MTPPRSRTSHPDWRAFAEYDTGDIIEVLEAHRADVIAVEVQAADGTVIATGLTHLRVMTELVHGPDGPTQKTWIIARQSAPQDPASDLPGA